MNQGHREAAVVDNPPLAELGRLGEARAHGLHQLAQGAAHLALHGRAGPVGCADEGADESWVAEDALAVGLGACRGDIEPVAVRTLRVAKSVGVEDVPRRLPLVVRAPSRLAQSEC